MNLGRSLLVIFVAVGCGGSVRENDDDDGRGSGGTGGSGGGGGGTTEPPGFLSGAHFLTFSTALSPAQPVVAIATFTRLGTSFSFTLHPLAAIDRRTPTGSLSEHGPFPYDEAALNVVLTSPLTIPGPANPITGTDIVIDQLAFASGRVAPTICGSATGNVVQPAMISLEGSTFTLIPITNLARAPEPPPINCAGDLADPL